MKEDSGTVDKHINTIIKKLHTQGESKYSKSEEKLLVSAASQSHGSHPPFIMVNSLTGEKTETMGNADHLLNPDATAHASYIQSLLAETNR